MPEEKDTLTDSSGNIDDGMAIVGSGLPTTARLAANHRIGVGMFEAGSPCQPNLPTIRGTLECL